MNFMFAGIGEDYRKVINKFDEKQKKTLKELSNRAKKIFNINIFEYLESDENIQRDELTVWSSIYTCDYIVYQKYIEIGLKPERMLGYSMGLITALACGEAITYEDGILILKTILEYHKPVFQEGMITIIGLSKNDLNEIINESNLCHYAEIACENNDYCFVVSGRREAITIIGKKAEKKGALKVHLLDTNFAFHTDMFKKGSELLQKCINDMNVKDLKIPIISIINQAIITDARLLKKELVNNMFSKMLWQKSILKVTEGGKGEFIEVSLGKTLIKVSRTIDYESSFYSYNYILK